VTLLGHIAVKAEEPFLIEKYGSTYREYMNRTPRWMGKPKPEKNGLTESKDDRP